MSEDGPSLIDKIINGPKKAQKYWETHKKYEEIVLVPRRQTIEFVIQVANLARPLFESNDPDDYLSLAEEFGYKHAYVPVGYEYPDPYGGVSEVEDKNSVRIGLNGLREKTLFIGSYREGGGVFFDFAALRHDMGAVILDSHFDCHGLQDVIDLNLFKDEYVSPKLRKKFAKEFIKDFIGDRYYESAPEVRRGFIYATHFFDCLMSDKITPYLDPTKKFTYEPLE